jgi:hypothetical protein
MGKFMIGLRRLLPLCAVVLVLPAVAASQLLPPPPPPPPPDFSPNLQPTGITFAPSSVVVGDTVFFDSGVRNTGDIDSGIFNIKWLVNGQEVGAAGSHAGVPAGQTVLDGNGSIRSF